MKRRTFVEQSVLTFLGLALSPSILTSCRKNSLFTDSKFSGKVIIIGAGAAGLYAGYILKSKGIDFTIIEASNRSGGRLGKNVDFADFPIDTGAQWLHGKKSILGDLVKKTETKITVDESSRVYWFNNEITQVMPSELEEFISEIEDGSDVSFLEFAQQQGLGDEYRYIIEQLAGDIGADASDVSVKWTAIEGENWSSGDVDYKFEKTFFDLINEAITEKVKSSILLSTPITNINYSNDGVLVTDNLGNTYQGDKVIITVPVPILQDGDITFTPALPVSKTQAFDKIGMGAGMKVFLKFSSKFYDENIIGGEVCAAYADDSVGKSGSDNVLLAFVMGHQAENLSMLGSDVDITNKLLAELDTMYSGQASSSFIDSYVEDWTTNPFVKGAYSYSKVGIGNARRIASEPVQNKLFFAGEAMNWNGHHQTVHGAIETGYREVINILKSK